MKYVDTDMFRDRFARCPGCSRDNVRLIYYMGGIVLEEHPTKELIATHAAPVDPGAPIHVIGLSTRARLRCPLSLAPVVEPDDESPGEIS